MDFKKIAGSFACFLALSGQAFSIDCNSLTQEYLKVQTTQKHANSKQYEQLCEEIKNASLMYFILTNDYGVDKRLVSSLKTSLSNIIIQAKRRLRNKTHMPKYDEIVYYSALSLQFLFENYNFSGGIFGLGESFDIVEFGKGIEQAKKVYGV